MKYENIKEVNATIKSIQKAEQELEKLSEYENGKINMIITLDSKTVMTIGCHKSFEHPFSTLAELFITDLIQLTRDKINKLTKHLESL